MGVHESTLLVAPGSPVDTHLWTSYQVARGFSPVYDRMLPGDAVLAAERQAFYGAKEEYIPNLRPNSLTDELLEAEDIALSGLKQIIAESGEDPRLVDAYGLRIDELLASARMLQAAALGNAADFDANNRFIYGDPDPEIFAAAADWICDSAEVSKRKFGKDRSVGECADTVLDKLESHRGDRSLLIPSQAIFNEVRARHFADGGFYSLLLAGANLPSAGKVRSGIGEPAIRHVLHNLGGTYERYQTKGKTWSASHRPKQLRGPAEYDMTMAHFLGLPVGHEAGSHILEAVNGGRSAIQILADGLDRYEHTNEGRALIREQITRGSAEEFAGTMRWQDILRRHLATSLGAGAAGGRFDFAQTYKVIHAIDRLWEAIKQPTDIADSIQRAQRRTYNLLERIFMGTDGRSGPFLRYMVYLEGNINCWRAEAQTPGIIEQGDLGKYGITRTDHRTLLQQFGVLETVN